MRIELRAENLDGLLHEIEVVCHEDEHLRVAGAHREEHEWIALLERGDRPRGPGEDPCAAVRALLELSLRVDPRGAASLPVQSNSLSEATGAYLADRVAELRQRHPR